MTQKPRQSENDALPEPKAAEWKVEAAKVAYALMALAAVAGATVAAWPYLERYLSIPGMTSKSVPLAGAVISYRLTPTTTSAPASDPATEPEGEAAAMPTGQEAEK